MSYSSTYFISSWWLNFALKKFILPTNSVLCTEYVLMVKGSRIHHCGIKIILNGRHLRIDFSPLNSLICLNTEPLKRTQLSEIRSPEFQNLGKLTLITKEEKRGKMDITPKLTLSPQKKRSYLPAIH